MPEQKGECNGPIAVPVGNEKHMICYGNDYPPGIGKPFNGGTMYCERSKFDSLPKS